jgi:TetR/AcrR family fatty acid metabolism transcriptional regulator
MSINAWYSSTMPSSHLQIDAKRDVKAAIFDAACRVIRDRGFHQARVTDIARQAGTSYGLVYHYFGSKADLFDAIFNEWWSGLFALMEELEAQTVSSREKLAAILDHFLSEYEARPELVHIFVTEISRSTPNLTPERLEFFKEFFRRTERIITQGQRDGVLRKDMKARYLTYIFVGAMEGFLSAMVLANQPLKGNSQKQNIASALLDVFFNGARIERTRAEGT